jgi:tetratricopeptide (TPR) repeat protein
MKKRALILTLVALAGCSKTGNADPAATSRARLTSAVVDDTRKGDDAATRLQRSYDAEATANLEEALAVLEPLPVTGHVGYVAQLRRAWLLYRLGRNADAVAAYEKAMGLAPGAIEPKVGALAPLAAMRRWIDVERLAREILTKDPASYAATIRLAFALYSQAKFADSATTYGVLLAAYPSDVDAGAGLGWALLKAGKSAQAAEAFDQVLAIAPKNALALDGMKAAKVSK